MDCVPTNPARTVKTKARICRFQRRFHVPGVIGCIDCTHIAIVKPQEDEHQYFNRKGYHSINVQMICDHNLKNFNVNLKFGGATHDSFIWSSSQVEQYMRGLHQNCEQTWLLGDSGYPQRAWLMTPILDAAPGSREEVYTTRHVQARNCIERCFGFLKPQLYLARAACRNAWVSYRLHTFSTGVITLVPSRVSQSLLTPRRPSDFDRRGVGGGGSDASAQSGLV